MAVDLDAYGPFDAGAGANFTEEKWRKMMRHMLGSASGIIRGFDNDCVPSAAGSGMTVTVDTGQVWSRGHWGEITSTKTLPIATAHASLARKDRIVLRGDFVNNKVVVDVLTGTPAASPTVPSLTQNTSMWETSIGVVDVPAGDTVITSGQVTDDRMYTTVQARYTKLSNQSSATNTFTKITFSTTALDSSGDITINSSGNEFTLLRSGLWVVEAHCRWVTNATGKREIILADPADVSGATCTDIIAQNSCQGISSIETSQSCVTIMRFPANQVVSAFAYQQSGGNLDIIGNTNRSTNISLVWIGP